jgi:hypothetical protein
MYTALRSASGNLEGRTSNADAATVTVNNSRLIASVPPRDTTIDVRQNALAQTNTGDTLTATDRAVGSGTHSFSIEVGGTTHDFNINVTAGDNNASIQRRMATAVNDANIGVRAGVTAANGETTLTFTAAQTGTNSAFTVTGNIADEMGVTTTNQAARNAIYSINGGFDRVAQSNEVSIGAGVTATLRGEGRTNITFGQNVQAVTRAATDLVNAINSALRNTNANDGRGSERFLNDLQGLNRTYASQLSRMGIDVQNNGQLAINQERLASAAADGSLGRLLDSSSGFGARVERISNNATNTRHYRNALNPLDFTSPNTGFNFGNTSGSWNMMNMFR